MKMPKTKHVATVLGAICLISSLLGLVSKKASAAKNDPCKQYQEKALGYLETMELDGNGTQQERLANVSRAYSEYYLVCRDLERQQ